MKFEFENGKHLGTAEWQGPGQVAVEMDDPDKKAWFEHYFESEDSYMAGSVEGDGDMRWYELEVPETSVPAKFTVCSIGFSGGSSTGCVRTILRRG